MIYVYAKDATDFSTIGLVGALMPERCTYTESANGESRVEMLHPLDDSGKYKALEVGAILRLPVPVRNAPAIVEGNQTVTQVTHWRIKQDGNGQTAADRVLYADKGLTKKLRNINQGTEVEKIWHDSRGTVAKIIYADREVYCKYSILEETGEAPTPIAGAAYGIEQALTSYTVRDQLFRIKSVTSELEGVTVQAWHIFYDLTGNVTDVHEKYETTAGTALNLILANCKTAHEFSGYTDSTDTQTELDWGLMSPVKAMLDPESGYAARYGLQLMRDNFDVFFVKNAGFDRGVWIEYGKNMTSVRYALDITNLITRVIPVGADKDGNDMLLEGDTPWVDADNIGDYPDPHTYVLRCSSACKVGSKKSEEEGGEITVAEARANMLQEAQDLLDTGVSVAWPSIDVDFEAIGDDPRYASLRQLENVFLWDTVHVKAPHIMPTVSLQICYVEWDVLNQRYISTRLGALDDTLASIDTWDIPQGISGGKIISGSISSAALSDGILRTRMLTAGLITADSAAIANAAIGTAAIADAAITNAKIGTAAITAAKIQDGEITNAKIGLAAVDTANIREAAITSATIAENAVVYGKIATAAVDTINIKTGAIDTAQIKDAAISSAKISSVNADTITAGTLATERLIIKGADGIIYEMNVQSSGLTPTELEDDKYKQYLNGTVIVAHSVTADQIAAGAITANEIAAGTIQAVNIASGAIETTHISAAAQEALILSASSAIDVGGTNLLKGTRQGFGNWGFWASQNSATYWDRTVTGLGNCRRYTATGAMDNFIVWTYISYEPLQAGVEYTINTKIANYGKACAYRMQTSEDGATWTNDGSYGSLPGYADGFHDFVFTWTPTATRYYRVGIIVQNFSGYIDLFDTWKLEAGNKATAWSPCPEEFTAGSTVTITEDRVDISTPLFSVNTYSDDGYIRVSASGVETGHLSASNVADRYDGPATITVNASAASDGLNTFRTLTDALAAISGKWLDYDVTISVATNTTENVMTLTGVYGRGSVTVNGGDKTANGRLIISNCASVFVNDLTVSCAGAVPIVQALRVQSLVLSGCSLVGNAASTQGSVALEAYNASVRVTSCGIYGVRMGLAARIGGNIYVNNCSGSCGAYALIATADGKIGITTNGTIPSASMAQTYTQDGGQIIGAGSSQGGTTPVTPTTTTTATFSASVSKTRSGASGWLTNTPTMQSGLLGSASNNNVGAMWFDLSSLAGNTVQSASITLTRLKRFADGTYVDGSSGAIILYAETATVSASGATGSTGLGTVANQSEIGRWSPGATVTAALPPAAVQAIINGTARALVVYSTDSALVSGKSYSANYAAFAGVGQSGAPVLSVTYT